MRRIRITCVPSASCTSFGRVTGTTAKPVSPACTGSCSNALRVACHGGNELHVSSSRAEINDLVLHRLNVLISADRDAYSEQLDFFEIRFDSAIAKLVPMH